MKNNFLNKIGAVILPGLLSVYLKTVRISISNDLRNEKAVFTFWHNKMLIGWYLFKGKKYSALVSKSKDGDTLTRILKKWKYNVTRGSSSKGGKEAVTKIIEEIKGTTSVVITPDGPRGPIYEVKNGPLVVANKTGYPVIPVKIVMGKKKTLNKSWDDFEIPLPFSKCTVEFGNKMYYPEYLDESQLGQFKNDLSLQM